MSAILTSLRNTVIAGFVLAVVIYFAVAAVESRDTAFDVTFWQYLFRYLHIVAGIMWIGHLWYFNFTQIPNMAKIPDEQKPAISKVIAPAALYWFRWGAMATLVTGLILAILLGYAHQAFMLQPPYVFIGIGMWLAVIMWFNVWFVIWPNQKKALGIVQVEPDVKAKAARTAMLFSRTNTLLSVPMLLCMAAQSHFG
jgi:uncharacterized membrane protein